MLCEIDQSYGLVTVWAFMTFMGLITVLSLSTAAFIPLYVFPTYDTWRFKSNPAYPDPAKVRLEVLQTLKGLGAAALAPAAALYLARNGTTNVYCGFAEQSFAYEVGMAIVLIIASDFLEWAYHYCGHRFATLWMAHKPHHVFYNPSPFSVIADDVLDQFMRATPILLFGFTPFPVNLDVLFGVYACFFYLYGTYLHSGHELSWPNAHTPYINSSFAHYIHHAKSIVNKPYHTGFFIQLWDRMAGSIYPIDKNCPCAKCCRDRGERTREAWEKVEKPDYSVLLSAEFWLQTDTKAATAAAVGAPEKAD